MRPLVCPRPLTFLLSAVTVVDPVDSDLLLLLLALFLLLLDGVYLGPGALAVPVRHCLLVGLMALLHQVLECTSFLVHFDSCPRSQLTGELVEEPELGKLVVCLDGRREQAPEAVGESGDGLVLAHPDAVHLDQDIILSHAIGLQKRLFHLLICPAYLHTPDSQPLLVGQDLVEMLPLGVIRCRAFVVGLDGLLEVIHVGLSAHFFRMKGDEFERPSLPRVARAGRRRRRPVRPPRPTSLSWTPSHCSFIHKVGRYFDFNYHSLLSRRGHQFMW